MDFKFTGEALSELIEHVKDNQLLKEYAVPLHALYVTWLRCSGTRRKLPATIQYAYDLKLKMRILLHAEVFRDKRVADGNEMISLLDRCEDIRTVERLILKRIANLKSRYAVFQEQTLDMLHYMGAKMAALNEEFGLDMQFVLNKIRRLQSIIELEEVENSIFCFQMKSRVKIHEIVCKKLMAVLIWKKDDEVKGVAKDNDAAWNQKFGLPDLDTEETIMYDWAMGKSSLLIYDRQNYIVYIHIFKGLLDREKQKWEEKHNKLE